MSSVAKLGSTVHFIRGITFKPEDVISPSDPNAVVCMRTKNIQNELDERDLIAVPAELVRRQELYLRAGDLLISSANSWELVGKTAYVNELPYRATAGGFIGIVRHRSDVLNPRYLFHWMRTPETLVALRNCGRQTTNISNLSTELFLDLDFPLPTSQEQQRIATILDKADAVRRKRREALKLADELLRSAFLDLFGDPVMNPKGWPLQSIKSLADVTTGNTPSRDFTNYYGDHIEWIKSDNINTPHHYLTKAAEGLSPAGLSVGRSVTSGSILITCIAGSPACIGNTALVDRPVAFNQQINALTPREGMESEFLYANVLFSKAKIQAASTQGMKGMVSKGALEQVRFIAPPPSLQKRFVKVFGRVMAATHRLDKAAVESEHLFNSVSARAFSGEMATT